MAKNYSKVHDYIKNEFNVLIVGPAGTGKTTIVKKVCNELGFKMKYIDASLADEFVDLVGIPAPDHENNVIKFFKTHDLLDAEVIVVDELNRGSRGFRNGILEASLEGAIKGEKLPNLRCLVAMMNPNEEGYQVDELDVALIDRFDARLYFEPSIDMRYFTDKFNRDVAKVVKKWWDDYNSQVKDKSNKNKKVYISPRRMDKVVTGFQKLPSFDTITDFMPAGVTGNLNGLFNDLNIAFGFKSSDDIEKEKEALRQQYRSRQAINLSDIKNLKHPVLRNSKSIEVVDLITKADKSDPDYRPAVDQVYDAIRMNVGPNNLSKIWAPIIKDHFTQDQRKELYTRWAPAKINEYNQNNTVNDKLTSN